jgi:hypothetical protein
MHPSRALFAALLTLAPSLASADEDVPVISAVLDYAKPDEAGFEAFFEKVLGSGGKVVRLNLEIIPKQGQDGPGYTLQSSSNKTVTCNQEEWGLVDNLRTDYVLSFQHPTNFHSSFTAYFGTRMNYPFHSLVCGVENASGAEFTHLHVDGHFVVAVSEIPTQNVVTLFPYNPH